MHLPDPKPLKRVRDSHALSEFYDHNHSCLVCGWGFTEAHHVLFRSHGGDDTRANLVALCGVCHGAVHGTAGIHGIRSSVTPEHAKRHLARFLRSDAGEDHCAYLIGKLGPFGAEAFVQRLEHGNVFACNPDESGGVA